MRSTVNLNSTSIYNLDYHFPLTKVSCHFCKYVQVLTVSSWEEAKNKELPVPDYHLCGHLVSEPRANKVQSEYSLKEECTGSGDRVLVVIGKRNNKVSVKDNIPL